MLSIDTKQNQRKKPTGVESPQENKTSSHSCYGLYSAGENDKTHDQMLSKFLANTEPILLNKMQNVNEKY